MKKLTILIPAAILAGCASTPSVTVDYYPTKSVVEYKVIRTIACDASNFPIVASQVTATTKHFADLSGNPLGSIKLDDIDGAWANSEVKVELYADGRLKGLNATTTGRGESIIKSAITLAAPLLAFATARPNECDFIKKAGNGKPLTLIFSESVDPSLGASLEIPPDPSSKNYFDELSSILGKVCASFASSATKIAPARAIPKKSDTALTIRQPGRVGSTVNIVDSGTCNSSGSVIWKGDQVLGQFGQEYQLLIPRAAVFGKQVIELALDESGALTSLKYGKETGLGQAFNVGESLRESLAGDTAAQQAAAIKAEADLIAQQQRLVRCLADPASCT